MDALTSELSASLVAAYNDRDGQAVRTHVRELCARFVRSRPHAVWHPLGFFGVELGSDGAGLRYVLHCWPQGVRKTKDPAWLIHRHACDLESCVLAGELKELEYEPVAQGASEHGTLYLVSGTPGHISRLDRTDHDLNLALRDRRVVSSGSFYRVDIGRFHQTYVPTEDYCVTLARTGPRLLRKPQVLGDTGGPSTLTYTHDTVDPTLVTRALEFCVM